jgi:hypothetical protein
MPDVDLVFVDRVSLSIDGLPGAMAFMDPDEARFTFAVCSNPESLIFWAFYFGYPRY